MKKAFTLVEVLMTLAIIGVVAAITIPTLVKKTGDDEIIAKLMKAYSAFGQATEAIILEDGAVRKWASNSYDLHEKYRKHIKHAKYCGDNAGCFRQSMKYLNGSSLATEWENRTDYSKLILADGVQAAFEYFSGEDCNHDSYGSISVCAYIWVDLNGKKEPNTFGRDIFRFALKEGGLYPAGCDDETANDCKIDSTGFGCSCNVITKGKIDY